MMKLLNALSLNMFVDFPLTVHLEEIEKPDLSQLESCIGHVDLANILNVPVNRVSVHLGRGESAVVAQYIGPQLVEGTTHLPEGATIKFFQVSIATVFYMSQYYKEFR